MLEYGSSYMRQNDAVLDLLREGMSPEAYELAQEQAREMLAEDEPYRGGHEMGCDFFMLWSVHDCTCTLSHQRSK